MIEMGGYGRALLVSSETKGYGSGTGKRHEAVQEAFVRVQEEAARMAGLRRDTWSRQPRGGGELALLPLGEREPLVVDDFIRSLNSALDAHNATFAKEDHIRLKVAIHYGVAYPTAHGLAGQAVAEVSRMIDWNPLKDLLELKETANLILLLSDRVYTDVVTQGHTTYDPKEFVKVHVQEKEFSGDAWVWAPGENLHGLDILARPEPAPPVVSQQVINNLYGAVDARRAVFGVSGIRP